MSNTDDERDDEVLEVEVEADSESNQSEVGRQSIKVVELGRKPKLITLDPDEQGRTIENLIGRDQLRSGMEYFVNGQRSSEGAMVVPGDAVVGVPKIRGG